MAWREHSAAWRDVSGGAPPADVGNAYGAGQGLGFDGQGNGKGQGWFRNNDNGRF